MVVVFTLVLAIGLTITTTLRTQETSVASSFDTETNFTALNLTAVSFNEGYQLSCTDVAIHNATYIDLTGQFTVVGCTASLQNSTFNNTVMSANYTFTYNVYSASYNATAENVSALSTIPSWFPIIIVAFIGGIVLFLIIKQFGGK